MNDKIETKTVPKQSKGLGPIAAVLIAVPALLFLSPFVLAYSAIKDSFKRCPACRSRSLELKGHTFTPGSAGCMVTTGDDAQTGPPLKTRRNSPCYEYYLCLNCKAKTRKLFGQQLEPCGDEEFGKLTPVDKTR